jgi:hypothetical protein
MDRIKRITGIAVLAAAALLLCAAIAAAVFYKGGFSPLNGFINELGLFSGGYFAASFALLFNLSLILFGLAFGALMVLDGLEKATIQSTALGFFGALTGVLTMAQGIFTLNISQFHYIVSAAFYISAFVLCALYVVFTLMGRGHKRIAPLAMAGCAGAVSAVYAWYILSGSMSQFLVEDASLTSRTGILPFALIGWASMALFMAFIVLYAVASLGGSKRIMKEDLFESTNDFI